MKIYLCGFMGCGKSTLLTSFGDEVDSYDLDDVILEKYAKDFNSLGDYIRSRGWEEFREVEARALRSLPLNDSAIVALGGGAIESSKNVEWIHANGVLVWLDIPLDECVKRISGDRNRPMLDLSEEELLSLFEKRRPLYMKAKVHLSRADISSLSSYREFRTLVAKKLDE